MVLSFRKARSFRRRPHGLRDRKQQRPLREEQSYETPEIADRTDTDNPFQDNHCLATAPDGPAPTTAVLAPMVTIGSAARLHGSPGSGESIGLCWRGFRPWTAP